MILEGIVTTINDDGGVNISPMGPVVDAAMTSLVLRPFKTSTTYKNLKRTSEGVLHVTDDVELIARAAVSRLESTPRLVKAQEVAGEVLADACRWYEFRVTSLDDSDERTNISCQVVHTVRQRDFFGFNRAKNAVIEAAILATRTEFLPPGEIIESFDRLKIIVDKTAGAQEHRAFQFLHEFVHEVLRESRTMPDRTVHVKAPSRLHFGLLSFGDAPRKYGGVGAMINTPATRLNITKNESFEIVGPFSNRVEQFARSWSEFHQLENPPLCRIEVIEAPRQHAGLGAGTQLGLSVAAGLSAFLDSPIPSPAELALSVGRGLRSAVGTHGFAEGGLIVEGGKRLGDLISPLDCRLEIPSEWRFVLISPNDQQGLSGKAEQHVFDLLPTVAENETELLRRELRDHMLPALAQANFELFSESVYEYGRRAGLCFAKQQGGPYNGQLLSEIVAAIRSLGFTGVGQSSWGPTLFSLAKDQHAAGELAGELRSTYPEFANNIWISPPNDSGAVVSLAESGEPVVQ